MFELSASQEIVWLHEELAPGSRAYNFTATIDLRGALHFDALHDAMAEVVARHAALRLELVVRPGQTPAQRVREQCVPRMYNVDLSGEADPERAFQELLYTESRTPLDTSEAPLLRWCVARMSERHHRIIQVEHHLIHDGWSFAALLREVFGGYRARVLGEDFDPPTAGSYWDYVLKQGSADAASIEFWQRELADAEFALPLPGMARPQNERTRDGEQSRQAIDPETAAALREVCRERGHTPFAAMLGMFAELLRRHSGRADLVIGTAVGNRPEGFETAIGMFVNTIPLRLNLEPGVSGAAALDRVTETLFRCLPHQNVPVQTITRALELHSDGMRNPLFDVLFSTHDAPLPHIDVPDLEISLLEGINTGTTRFDLDVVLLQDDRRVVASPAGGAGMTLIWEFDTGLFTAQAVGELQDRFLALLKAYIAEPDATFASLGATPMSASTQTEAAHDALLDDWRHRPPGDMAIVSGADRITYGELDRRVTDLAAELRAAGVRAGQPVAVVLPRGIDSIVVLLACVCLSAVYCPLSPDDPPARLAQLVRRLNPSLLVTTASCASAIPQSEVPTALLDRSAFPAATGVPSIGDEAAYVIHTSGSTGIPKPVVVGRVALASYVERIVDRFALTAEDRVLHVAQPVFDVSLEEVLPTLRAGACIVIPHVDVPTPAELVDVLVLRRVTVVNLTTSYLLAAQDDMCVALADGRWSPRLIIFFGDRVFGDMLRPLREATDAVLLNAYGITEAVVTTTTHEVTTADLSADDVPLGTELPGTKMYVLDGHWPLPDGAVGELAIGGGLASGYLGDETTTSARFPELAGERVYLSGDLGYRDTAGRLRFLGRVDNQVKLRGFRIELEEVEAVAAEVLGLPRCVVVLDKAAEAPRLIGFYASAEDIDGAAAHATLAQRLPASHVPSDWARLDRLPTLHSGKPDRDALTKLAAEVRRVETASVEAFDDAMWSLVARGWREVLGHDQFTSTSDFFQVGGHSMLVAQLAAWLEPELGDRPPLRVLFRHSVLEQQANAIRELVS